MRERSLGGKWWKQCVRKRNSEESDYSSINVHNATHNNGNWRKQNRERVEKECDTEASWLSMYMATTLRSS